MIVRLIVLCLSGAGAYALLGGIPQGVPALVRSCLAVLLLVGGLATWASKRSKSDLPVAKGARKPGLPDYLAMGMGILALECGFLWLLNAAPEPLERMAIRLEAKLQPAAAAERMSGDKAPTGGNWLWSDVSRRALPQRTNLKPGAKPEVFVKLPRVKDAERLLKRKVYVRAFALDRFDRGVWSLDDGKERELGADEQGWIGLGQRREDEILHEVFHGMEGGGRDALTALQGVRAVRLPSLRLMADGMGYLPQVGGPSGFSYLASSVPLALEDLDAGADWGDGKAVENGGRFAALSAKAAGEGDLLKRLLAIQSHLRNNYGYSLVTANRDGIDPLENFLFNEKRGHCEFFATAGALMAREIGAEARVAYGWAGGEYFPESRMFVFRAREAHAWVEVNMKGLGWVVMEPTPPVALGGGGSPRIAEAGDKPPSVEAELTEDPEQAIVARGGDVERVSIILAAVFGAVAAFAFLSRIGRGEQSGEGSGKPSPSVGKSGYYGLWKRACERRGIMRRTGWTLRRQISEMGEPPAFADDLLAYHYGVRYEDKPAEHDRESRLRSEIRDWGR